MNAFSVRNVAGEYNGWLTNLPRFQGARPDHVQVESLRCCCPRVSLRARSVRPKFPVRITEIFVSQMERYFPPGRTDRVPFLLEHISRQDLLDKIYNAEGS